MYFLINSEDGYPILIKELSLNENTYEPHGLNTVPITLAWFSNGSTYVQTGLMSNAATGVGGILAITADNTNVNFIKSGLGTTIAPYYNNAYIRLYPNG